jgi:hypothetical protein
MGDLDSIRLTGTHGSTVLEGRPSGFFESTKMISILQFCQACQARQIT